MVSSKVVSYVIRRILQCLVVIFVSTTVVFIIPRMATDMSPVESAISRAMAQGQYTDPKAVEQLRNTLEVAYGLEGTVFEQYVKFWKNILRGDLGPSFSSFPTPVMDLIRNSLPWTVGLLLVTTVLSWVIGNILGGIVGCNRNKKWAKGLEVTINALRPIPYYIMALLLLIVFSYILPLFPSGGAYPIGTVPRRDWSFFVDVLKHAFLPGLSLILVGIGGWFQGMRTLVSHIMGEDYVVYAKLANLNKKDIFSNYIMRNAMLPQITGLALQLGMIFSGTLITEIVFNYPGLGLLSYNAILRSDYNLIMGVTILSIVAVSFGTLIIDLLYPLLDPRIAY